MFAGRFLSLLQVERVPHLIWNSVHVERRAEIPFVFVHATMNYLCNWAAAKKRAPAQRRLAALWTLAGPLTPQTTIFATSCCTGE